ncbi:hypothetical protein WK80_25805 [Burkholderia multivorans]|uniref:hypothetical protein n=1 Tax=Burkholderia multivorans TaxID=87883 RepID=UPI00075F07A2|nr:hypothetical protein [Burkholderia multivorans]KVV19336.1 hypothetical protein WK80_25805 [Burkholderia multivorans]MBU9205210.1 hypothetical protein [Burkholderia multivorans]MCA8386117.1 hypothetical protein [Burkholderia multivorans]MCO8315857.1 hypothetical protein [Burkholderia multivorans]MCO8354194.1 hypothetical protein [Burkholderia multivorans]
MTALARAPVRLAALRSHRFLLKEQPQLMQRDKVAADVFVPHRLYRFPQPFGILERPAASHNFQNQPPQFVTVRIA